AGWPQHVPVPQVAVQPCHALAYQGGLRVVELAVEQPGHHRLDRALAGAADAALLDGAAQVRQPPLVGVELAPARGRGVRCRQLEPAQEQRCLARYDPVPGCTSGMRARERRTEGARGLWRGGAVLDQLELEQPGPGRDDLSDPSTAVDLCQPREAGRLEEGG